jgi:hypothetical protein
MNRESTTRDELATASSEASAAEARSAAHAVAPDDLEHPIAEKQTPSKSEDESLDPLFSPDVARDFRASWDAVQIGFVDDPKQAVRKADELVRQVLENLTQTFSNERSALEAGTERAEQASTENLRVALRRYRSFLQRLLSL